MKHFILFTIFLFATLFSKAQSSFDVNGVLKDSTDLTVIGAAVKLTSSQDSLVTVTGVDGKFSFKNVKSNQFILSISALGYQTVRRNFQNNEGKSNLILNNIIMKSDSKLLGEVLVNGTPDVVVKDDTLQYRADAYQLKENALAEDLLKKLPGVEVDRDGNVTAQGKAITRIRVNGKDFFGGDVKTATQQLPADMLQNVQIIDDYGDQANLTGVRDGEPDKILNFTIRQDRNKGYLTRGTVGIGDKDRYQASVFAAKFNNNQQISILANLNNTNANIFSLTGGGGGGGGRRGPSGGGGGGFGSNGLTNVQSLGINYRDQWSDKITAYGTYSIFSRENIISSNVFQKTLGSANNTSEIDNNRETDTNSENINHRFEFNIEYKIDSLNYLKFTPRANYSLTDRNEISDFSIYRDNVLSSNGRYIDVNESTNPNFGADFLYNHRFAGTTRNLSFSAFLNTNSSKSNQDYLNRSLEQGNDPLAAAENLYQKQLIENDNTTNNINIRTSYIEPLSKTKSLEFNYEYGFNKIDNNRTVLESLTEGVNPSFSSDFSNEYQYSFQTNRFGLNYRVNETKYNYTLGFGLQPSVLKGESATLNTSSRTTALNMFPSARFQYKFSRSKELSVNYNGRSNQPGYNQLQPVTDRSNPQFPIIGNPDLNAEFSNNVNLRYNASNPTSGTSFFTNFNYNFTKDKIVSSVRTQNLGSDNAIQETGYTNADGYYTLNGFYSFNKPLADKKYVFGLRGMANYNNNISFIDDAENIGKNLVLSQRLQIQIQPKEWLEVVPAVSYSYNRNNNSINERSNSVVHNWSTSFDSKIYFTKTFLWGTQFDKNFNRGFNSVSTNPFIINTYLEKQFFKGNTGALRLTAFDLLDESTSISRTVNANSIIDSSSNRLSRYFMLTFTMRINKFAGQSGQNSDMNRDFRPGGGSRGPGAGGPPGIF